MSYHVYHTRLAHKSTLFIALSIVILLKLTHKERETRSNSSQRNVAKTAFNQKKTLTCSVFPQQLKIGMTHVFVCGDCKRRQCEALFKINKSPSDTTSFL